MAVCSFILASTVKIYILFHTLWKWDQGLQVYTDPYKSNRRSKKWHFSWLKINSLVDKYHSCQAPSQLTAISHHQQPINHDKPNHIMIKKIYG